MLSHPYDPQNIHNKEKWKKFPHAHLHTSKVKQKTKRMKNQVFAGWYYQATYNIHISFYLIEMQLQSSIAAVH